MNVSRKLSDRLTSLENNVEGVKGRQHKLMEMLVKIHELLKFRDQSAARDSTIPSIEDENDFESVEHALMDDSTRNEFVKNIKRLGGSNYVDMVNITLDRIMTIRFQSEWNLDGRNNKRAFKDTKLCSAITDAVLAAFPKTADATDQKIKSAIGKHLKRAPFKKGGTGKLNK
eukprot:TCONS_00030962-protein